jgi:hypothetical protein
MGDHDCVARSIEHVDDAKVAMAKAVETFPLTLLGLRHCMRNGRELVRSVYREVERSSRRSK